MSVIEEIREKTAITTPKTRKKTWRWLKIFYKMFCGQMRPMSELQHTIFRAKALNPAVNPAVKHGGGSI